MTAHLSQIDIARLRKEGITPLTHKEGLALMDLALKTDSAFLIPIKLNINKLQKG